MTDRRAIAVMPAELALKIAAGEVVERPASAVKELLDNAIDAGASRIAVEIQDAGLKRIRVSDDGHGIPRSEVQLAFQSHATSKIRDFGDLQHLVSLGFRGEALPSIAAISRLEIQTRLAAEVVGTSLSVEFGHIGDPTPSTCNVGTRVTVSDLFANVPARRTFVRSLRAEAGQISSTVSRYALAHPAVRFTLTLDGRPTFASPGSGKLEDVASEVFGWQVVESMLPVETNERGIGVVGLTSAPSVSRPNRSHIYLFVNGRLVANKSLLFALEEAYSGFLMTGHHPLAAMHLTLDPEEVDANIHPSKSEVRFAREREVHGTLHRAVGTALMRHRMSDRGAAVDLSDTALDGLADDEQAALDLDEAPDQQPMPALQSMPALRVFGQANATFIIAEGPNGLYMIDQHAAHERVLFDQFDADMDAGSVPSQPLLEAASVDLTPEQMAALEANGELLTRAGFRLEPFGTGACLVRSVPALNGRAGPVDLVTEVLSELEAMSEPATARERTLAAMACKAAVKAGSMLDVQEMRELVAQLERTPRPATCPHGRPTMIHLSHSQLEREFGRR